MCATCLDDKGGVDVTAPRLELAPQTRHLVHIQEELRRVTAPRKGE